MDRDISKVTPQMVDAAFRALNQEWHETARDALTAALADAIALLPANDREA